MKINKGITDSVLLSGVQILNLIVPVFLFPYLIHAIGVIAIGSWTIILSITGFFQIVTDYSFQSNFLNEYVNASSENSKYALYIYSLLIKAGLLLFSVLLCVSLFLWILNLSRPEIFAVIALITGNSLNCFWIYQARQKLKELSGISTFFKVVNAILIFLFVKGPKDYDWLLLIASSTSLANGLLLNILIKVPTGFSLKNISIKKLKFYSWQGFRLMVTNLSISGYTSLKLILVSKFTLPYDFGIFSILDKIVTIIQTIPLTSVIQVLYPNLSATYIQEKKAFFRKVFRYQTIVNVVFLLEIIFFYFIHPFVFETLLNVSVSKNFSLLLILFLLNSFITNTTAVKLQYFLVSNSYKIYFDIHFYAALAGVFLIIVFTKFAGLLGGISAVLITTATIVFLTHLAYKKHYENFARRLGFSAL